MLQRSRLVINIGNLLELVGAAAGVYGVYRLVGLAWALIAAAVLLIVAAEFIYDGRLVGIPLPHRPHPRRRIARFVNGGQRRFWRLRFRVERWRARRTAS